MPLEIAGHDEKTTATRFENKEAYHLHLFLRYKIHKRRELQSYTSAKYETIQTNN
jgi:hypothetical protein